MTTTRLLAGVALILGASFSPARAVAQEGQPPAGAVVRQGKGPPPGAPVQGAPPGAPGQVPVGPDGKPIGQAAEQPKPGEPPKTEGPKATARPAKPATPPNPEELKALLDENGRVRFNFQGQPWLDVLEWLAKISNLSLDWQEVPGDFLNLRTQRSYTVDEARDLVNRHLLDRGYTLLKHGEVLTVVNIKKLDPSLVPRVAPGDLDERDPHEFVKVSFALDSLTAETATEELKPMLSPNGKLSGLKATNRIEALDAVINLREIRDVLAHEQSNKGRQRLVKEFPLQYTRAGDVLENLQDLLGIEKKPPQAGPPSPQELMRQQQMAMMQQQGGQPAPPKPTPSVHMVANNRENSIVAVAPANQMALITEAVKIIDVPSANSQSLLKNMSRTQVYRLAAVDPEPLVKMLQDLGDLDPTTRLQIDKKNRSIIAYGSLADHLTIRTLVKKLDGTDRKFEVVKLRRLEADYVAGTIEFMMGGAEKKKNQNNRYYPFYIFDGFGGRNNEEEDTRKFRVDADVEHNRLLLWANDIELEEVNHLLVKLGEIPGEGGNLSTLRILDTIPPEEVDQLLERLRRTWPGVGPNPLEIVPPADADSDEPRSRPAPSRKKPLRSKRPPDETTTQAPRRKRPVESAPVETRLLSLVQVADETPSEEAGENEQVSPDADPPGSKTPAQKLDESKTDRDGSGLGSGDDEAIENSDESNAPLPGNFGKRRNPRGAPAAPAPIRIGRGPDGKLVISSPDTMALDRLEDLLIEIAPPRKDYKIFKLKYKTTWAYGVARNLKDFFEEKDKNDQRNGRFGFYYGMQNNSNENERKLSKRRPLKFIDDTDSNSILVTGADANQLKIIEELIDMYDVPESKDSAARRVTQIVPIKYSKARVIGDAIKEVYRDLLSANDPALQNNQNKDQKQKPPDAMYTYINNFGGDEKKPDMPAKFKGLLSLGIDEVSNTLIVSAAEGLLENVVEMVEVLDESAKPTVNRMRVLKIDRNIDASELQKKLKSLVSKPPPPPQQGQPGQPRGPQPAQNGQPPHPDSTVIVDQ